MNALLALQDVAPDFLNFDPASQRDIIGAWLICFFTLAVFSFLYKDNPFYKIAEHVFVGVGTAYYALQYYEEGILEPVVDQMANIWEKIGENQELALLGQETLPFMLGEFPAMPWFALIFRGLAGVFGVMLLVRLFAPTSWAPRWPLAIMVGVYSALKLTGETQSKLVGIVKGMMKPIVPDGTDLSQGWLPDGVAIEATPLFLAIANVILLVGVICALSHFLFTWKRTKVLSGMSRAGIVVLMVTFGSMFGFTVLGRIALLIKRVSELFDFSESQYSLGGGSTLLTPPILLTLLIAGLLTLFALQKKDGRRS